MSEETIQYHYGKHHHTYVDKLNTLIPGTEFEGLSLENIICKSSDGIFNQAAQVWNHTFYWESLTDKVNQTPGGELLDAINQHFGSFEQFKKLFTQQALTLFGSGWVWLVVNKNNELEIIQTSNAENPLTEGHTPLLTCDVWEHAYYIDTRNSRPKYLDNFWVLTNWAKVLERFQNWQHYE